MIILGLDPGTKVTGYGLLQSGAKPKLIEAGTLEGGNDDLPARLVSIHDGLVEILKEFQPSLGVVEYVYSQAWRPRSGIALAHCRGVLLLALAKATIPIVEYTPSSVKAALTGNGAAGKQQVRTAIEREMTISLADQPFDVSDALALALTGAWRQSRDTKLQSLILGNERSARNTVPNHR